MRIWFAGALLWVLFVPVAGSNCLDCHSASALQAGDPHGFLGQHCSACHLGDPATTAIEATHRGLVVTPGQAEDVDATCGTCHAAQVASVRANRMHGGRGMVDVTRFTFGETPEPAGNGNLADLGHSPADSLLRKLCASCHLGQPLHQIETGQAIGTRGGGCLACHLPHGSNPSHPQLTARVSDENCVGCHSRSGRIALSYAGLAEVEDTALQRLDTSRLGYLADGRLVERHEPDVHHRAGLGCVDCHTVRDLMGPTAETPHDAATVDIQCRDCHANHQPRMRLADWPEDLLSLRDRIPFATRAEQPFLVTERNGTPLWHIQVTPRGLLLHRKLQGGTAEIPPLSEIHHPHDGHHRRLDCSACHSPWAPQCYGCHLRYEREGEQWDHQERAFTLGVWHERRWDVRNDRPALGIDSSGHVVPFVPGMIRQVEHPDWSEPRFRRLFAPIVPHTTGRSGTCAACHRSGRVLGLGEGTLHKTGGGWVFKPAAPLLADGLPADAFVTLDGRQAEVAHPGARAFNPKELLRILNALSEDP